MAVCTISTTTQGALIGSTRHRPRLCTAAISHFKLAIGTTVVGARFVLRGLEQLSVLLGRFLFCAKTRHEQAVGDRRPEQGELRLGVSDQSRSVSPGENNRGCGSLYK